MRRANGRGGWSTMGIESSSRRLKRAIRAPVGHAVRLAEPLMRMEHELAVCAIFREEARFFDEWISFHLGVGVTHFYLYNNFSTDNYQEVLQPWIAKGLVTLTDWPVPFGQVAAYRDCIRRHRTACRWIAFIDVDEFLFSPKTTDVRTVLRNYTDLPGVEVWQAFYGSGGHVKRPALPVTEAYLKRAPLTRTTVKTIANPRLVYRAGVHQSKYWLGEGRDTLRREVHAAVKDCVLDELRINHYWSRSLEDLHSKIYRGDSAIPGTRDPSFYIDNEKLMNAETDEAILPLARAIGVKAGLRGEAGADAPA